MQHGVVSAAQLRALGLSANEITTRARRGWLRRLHRSVYAVGHRPLTWRGRWLAAVLACGDGAALSHGSAAALWRVSADRSYPIHVTVPATSGRISRGGITLHRSRHLPPDEITRCHGISVTTITRTVLDLAATEPRRRVERALDEADRLRLCTLPQLRATLQANRGRPGAVALAAILAEHEIGTTLTQNELEELFFALCREHGLPQPQANQPVLDYHPDFLWPDAMLIVEIDGRGSHATRRAFQEDRTRDARLTAGYRVLRFTEPDVKRRQALVANRVRNTRRLILGDRG